MRVYDHHQLRFNIFTLSQCECYKSFTQICLIHLPYTWFESLNCLCVVVLLCLCSFFLYFVYYLYTIHFGFNFMHHEYDVRLVGNKTDEEKKSQQHNHLYTPKKQLKWNCVSSQHRYRNLWSLIKPILRSH